MGGIGFGAERLGLLACWRPWLTLVIHIAIGAICAIGFARIEIDSQLGQIFRSEHPDYLTYEKFLEKFPASGNDILIVLQGERLLERDTLQRLIGLQLDLEFVDGSNGVVSMFSVRRAPNAEGYSAPVFPDELPEGDAYDQMIAEAKAHPLIRGKLLSGDGKLALMIMALDGDIMETSFQPAVAAAREAVSAALQDTSIEGTLTGVPVMRDEIHQAIASDRITYNVGGFLIGCLVSLLFFRNLAVVAIAAAAPGIAVLWSFGIFGWLGQELNILIVVVAPLVMVIAFSDAIHMLFAIRRGLDEGLDIEGAAQRAVRTIGPACVLASVTTALALLSLLAAESEPIRNFGVHAAGAALLAYFSVITIVPALSIILLGKVSGWRARAAENLALIQRLHRLSARLADMTAKHAVAISLVGVILFVVAGTALVSLKPRYQLDDYLPDDREAGYGLQALDRSLGGSQALHLMITWPEGLTIADPNVRDAIAAGHRAMDSRPDIHNVWSLQSLRGWLETAEGQAAREVAAELSQLPPHLLRRLISEDGRTALITGRIANVASEASRAILNDLSPAIDDLIEANPGFRFDVTGLSTIFARHSSPMIRSLERSIYLAATLALLLIAVAFRSILPALLSILPNLLPIFAAGAVLYVTDLGFQLSSGIAMTVALGLAVDDTIHFLHRYHLERGRGKDVEMAVRDTMRMIGAVLMLTTTVLVLGIGVTLFSDVPSNRLFGQLAGVILFAALLADVIILPAMIITLRKAGFKLDWGRSRRTDAGIPTGPS